jgi:hypothetical protein
VRSLGLILERFEVSICLCLCPLIIAGPTTRARLVCQFNKWSRHHLSTLP